MLPPDRIHISSVASMVAILRSTYYQLKDSHDENSQEQEQKQKQGTEHSLGHFSVQVSYGEDHRARSRDVGSMKLWFTSAPSIIRPCLRSETPVPSMISNLRCCASIVFLLAMVDGLTRPSHLQTDLFIEASQSRIPDTGTTFFGMFDID